MKCTIDQIIAEIGNARKESDMADQIYKKVVDQYMEAEDTETARGSTPSRRQHEDVSQPLPGMPIRNGRQDRDGGALRSLDGARICRSGRAPRSTTSAFRTP